MKNTNLPLELPRPREAAQRDYVAPRIEKAETLAEVTGVVKATGTG